MRGAIYRLFYRTEQVIHPKGYIIHSESRRFGRQTLINLCVWDGTVWHQAPLESWDRTEGINYLEIWVRAHLPRDAWDAQ